MDVTKLYQLMENPSLLNKETLSELKQLIGQYPYFQTARILYLKNLAVLEDDNFGTELKKMAIYISDRKRLFSFIEGEKSGLKKTLQKESTVNPTASFDLIDSYLTSHQEEAGSNIEVDSSTLFNVSLSTDYLHWSIHKENTGLEEKDSSPPLQHQDLIDSFIKEDEQRMPGSGIRFTDESDSSEEYLEEVNPSEEASLISNDDSYFTETLARIYIKQKRYNKALQIIRQLSLKYPEKNVYFADQIRFLEKLITNNIKQN